VKSVSNLLGGTLVSYAYAVKAGSTDLLDGPRGCRFQAVFHLDFAGAPPQLGQGGLELEIS